MGDRERKRGIEGFVNTRFPYKGFHDTMSRSMKSLSFHQKKVKYICFHPLTNVGYPYLLTVLLPVNLTTFDVKSSKKSTKIKAGGAELKEFLMGK